jgi:hypothetical protein
LEDIYRHYDNVNNRVDDHGEDADKDDELNEDYDGQIMGVLLPSAATRRSSGQAGS